LAAALEEAQALILSDYGKGVLTPRLLRGAIAMARKARVPVTVDPKIEHFKRYRQVTCITPNLHEAWTGMRRPPKKDGQAIEQLGRDILKTLRTESVLITRGPDGMSLFRDGSAVRHIPTQAREVFDVTGAGDTVISTLTLALASGANIVNAAVVSNYAAGIVVGKLGTATTTIKELNAVLK
jgi:D-beta-D-heptose 7-phosphate kinase/D-beta-D-heptose 1-phosphate adenosyltransferase